MSFALTTEQILARTKTVTRRVGWKTLKPGDLIRPVKKCMGLKKGEKLEPIGPVLRVVSVRREPLCAMACDDEAIRKYGRRECKREGFPNTDPRDFVSWFAASHKCDELDDVTRIEFEYV